MPVTVFDHPPGSVEMASQRPARARRFAPRVDVQDSACDLLPIRPIGIGLEQPKISHQVLLVVTRQAIDHGSAIGALWIKGRTMHDTHLPNGSPRLVPPI